MKTTVSFYNFERAFVDMDRSENFTYDGLKLLYDYLEDLGEDSGEEIELDVIAFCCEYQEDEYREIAIAYDIDISDCEDDEEVKDTVANYLRNHTIIVGDTQTGFVYV